MNNLKDRPYTRSYSIPIGLFEKVERYSKLKGSNPNKACKEAFELWVEREESHKTVEVSA